MARKRKKTPRPVYAGSHQPYPASWTNFLTVREVLNQIKTHEMHDNDLTNIREIRRTSGPSGLELYFNT